MPMYFYPGMSGTGMAEWMIVATIFWVAVAVVVLWALARLVPRAPHQTDTSPRDEPDAATFGEMMAQLTETEEVPPSSEVRNAVSQNSTPWTPTGSGIPTGIL